jgi:hypothetical protein
MNKTTVFDSYNNYHKFVIQPFFDHSKFKFVQEVQTNNMKSQYYLK